MSVSVIVCSLIFLVSIEHSASTDDSTVESYGQDSDQWWDDFFTKCQAYFDALYDGYFDLIEQDEMPPCYKETLEKEGIAEGDAEDCFYQLLDNYYSMSSADQTKFDDCLTECDKAVTEYANAKMTEDCEMMLNEWYDYPSESYSEPSEEKTQEKMRLRLYRKLRHR